MHFNDSDYRLESYRPVLPKKGCRGLLNHTKSDTIALTKCIFNQLQLGKKHKTSMKAPKQKLGKHCYRQTNGRTDRNTHC